MRFSEYDTFCRGFRGVVFALKGDLFIKGGDMTCEGSGVLWASVACWAGMAFGDAEVEVNPVEVWAI